MPTNCPGSKSDFRHGRDGGKYEGGHAWLNTGNKTNEALLGRDLFGEIVKPDIKGELKKKFLIPPFSVLSARDGDWQNRKRQWLQLGIKSEVGRGGGSEPGGSARPAADYSNRERGTDSGKAIEGTSANTLGRKEGLTWGDYSLDNNLKSGVSSAPNHPKSGTLGAIAPNQGGDNGILTSPGKYQTKSGKGLAQSNGQDLMKGENPNFRPSTRALNTQEWVKQKIEEGDINGGMASGQSGTSIFDPVLCELMYSWFCREGGQILDPFCGGSVRGVVASLMGYKYWGCDLRQEQIDANYAQVFLCGDNKPSWVTGDALDILKDAPESDFIFTCPPYGDLEVYSDNPKDISTMEFPKFITTFKEIIKLSCDKLKENRFACIVVGDYRDKQGFYRCFPQHTIRGFLDCGLKLYNEIILVTSVGSLPIRITKQFEASRKIGKTHQNVLVFCKGNPRNFDK